MKTPAELTGEVLKVIENLPGRFLVLSPDLIILTASGAWLEMAGLQRGKITGKPLTEVNPENPAIRGGTGPGSLLQSLRQVLSARTAHRMEIQVSPPSGQQQVRLNSGTRYWQAVNVPVTGDRGEVQYIIHQLEDVTVQVLLEQHGKLIQEGHTHNNSQPDQPQIPETGQAAPAGETTQDTSVQGEARKRIEETESLLRATEEVAQTGSYEADIATLSFRFSDGMFRLFGEDPQFFVPTLEFIDSRSDPDDARAVKQVLEQAAASKQPYYYTRRIQRKNGEWRTVESHGKVVCDQAGNAVKFIGLVQDITERRKAEETIQQMLHGSVAGILILESVRDEAGRVLDFICRGSNKAARRLHPVSPGELTGRRLRELFPATEEAMLVSCIRVVETGEPLREERSYPDGGQDCWFDISAVRNGDGLIMTLLDITAQKKAEQELLQVKEELAQRATDRYLTLFNSIDQGFCILEVILDSGGKPADYRHIDINPAFENQTGLQNARGKTIRELVPDMEPFWIELYGKVALTGEPVRIRDYVRSMRRWYDVNAFRIGHPEEHQVAVLFSDITESKLAEQEKNILLARTQALNQELEISQHRLLEQNENLTKINAELDSFVYRTSHDLRAPLASVLGLINIMRLDAGGESQPVYLDLMEKSISRLDTFISDIINYSRNTRIQVSHQEINLQDLVKDALEGLKYMEGYETLEKRVEISQPVPFLSDAFRLKIICNNLISNAIKYRSLTETPSVVWIKITVDPEKALLEFRDNGRGIDPAQMDKIFDMFYRASDTSKGSGLGLYIVREVVQTLKGTISVQSKPGVGTHFTIQIPNYPAA